MHCVCACTLEVRMNVCICGIASKRRKPGNPPFPFLTLACSDRCFHTLLTRPPGPLAPSRFHPEIRGDRSRHPIRTRAGTRHRTSDAKPGNLLDRGRSGTIQGLRRGSEALSGSGTAAPRALGALRQFHVQLVSVWNLSIMYFRSTHSRALCCGCPLFLRSPSSPFVDPDIHAE